MKKISIKFKERLYRLSQYRQKRDWNKRRLLLRAKRNQKRQQLLFGGENVILDAPEVFCLEPKHIKSMVKFIQNLQKYAHQRDIGRICIDFSHTRLMVADGTLFFLAHIDILKIKYPNKFFSMRYPKNQLVEQVLQQVGLTKLLNKKPRLQEGSFDKTVRFWHFASGCKVNTAQAENIFDSFEGRLTPELQKSIYTGISEAMTNSFHHAYEQDDFPENQRKWWLFSREYKGELQVIFCDLGIGIPKSLYQYSNKINANWFKILKEKLSEYKKNGRIINDASKIKAAIEIGKSRTNLVNRGKGLKQMVDSLNIMGNNKAEVMIMSNQGVYRKHHDKELLYPISDNKRISLQGTMIHWSIPLNCPQQETMP